jgi:hypothetical protein
MGFGRYKQGLGYVNATIALSEVSMATLGMFYPSVSGGTRIAKCNLNFGAYVDALHWW